MAKAARYKLTSLNWRKGIIYLIVSIRSIFDDLNWTVWMQTDWYVEAYWKEPFYGSFPRQRSGRAEQLQNKLSSFRAGGEIPLNNADQRPHQYLNILSARAAHWFFTSNHEECGEWNQNKLLARERIGLLFMHFEPFSREVSSLWYADESLKGLKSIWTKRRRVVARRN